MMRFGEVTLTVDGAVATVELDRPPHNFVTVGLMRSLADALDVVDAEPGLRASVLCSTGSAFCAGADLTGGDDPTLDAGDGQFPLYVQAVRLFSVRKPIVAAIQGAAVGAGLGLALTADFRVAAPEARFAANFVKLGFHPGFGVSHTLARVVGEQRAALMMLTGRRIKGEEALAWGLADELVPSTAVRSAAARLAAELAENAPLAVQATRATLRAGLAEAVRRQTDVEWAAQTSLRGTADYAEGVRAVTERRPGRFVGA